jgi:protocatechuate 3,4-dioxygenase beta subunit
MGFLRYFTLQRDDRRSTRAKRARAFLKVEALESRFLPSGATISGFVYYDANNNGLYDPGETPLANNPIELHDASNKVVATTVTDANGFYTFGTDPRVNTNPTTLSHTISFPETPTDWTATQSVPQFDPSLGTLTSVEILNADPIKNTIKVENLDTAADQIHVTMTGTLTLSAPGVSGLVTNLSADQTFSASAFDGTIDFGGTSGHTFAPQTVNGSNSTTLTAATDLAQYIGTGTVSFTEATHASSMATGSANLLVQVNTTAASNVTVIYHYIPSNSLTPGNYTIVQTSDPPGYLDGLVTAGNVSPVPNSVGTNLIHVTLGNTNLTNNNFGEIKPASLGGFVYADQNDNGVKDAGENGLPNITVSLTGTDDTGHAVNLTQATAADGSYNFAGLRPGTYALSETGSDGYLDGKATIGSQGGTAGQDTLTNIVVTPGVVGVNNNFGELSATSLSGFVYVDSNNNGVKDPGEAGVSGATVTLTGTDDEGHAVNLTQTSAADGSYGFNNLRPGSYSLHETNQGNYLDGKDTVGSQGGTVSQDLFSNINLQPGVAGVNNNFGELQPASLSGFVYVDANNNGVKDPSEAGVSGATVTLTGTNDRNQAVSLTQTTGADGSFSFTSLRPGTYALSESNTGNYLDGKDTIGSQGGTAGKDQLSNITLASGVVGANNDFGELQPTGLSGFVYVDVNDNGVKDAGDTGIAGITVTLTGTDDLGHAVNLTQVTAADGSYSFNSLRPGTYALGETGSDGYLNGQDTVGSQGGTAGHDTISNIVLAAGVSGANNNFGELQPASLAGVVWLDSNDNGVKDGGEKGIGAVTVTLTGTNDKNQPITVSQPTGADGSYNFANLRPGNYSLTEMPPAGYMDGKDTIGTQGGTMSSDKFSNIQLPQGMAGVNNNFAELLPGSLSGFVYADANNNGVKDPGESGIAGVSVALTGVNDLGQTVNRTQPTAADGSYNFDNVRPGTYTLTKTPPSGWLEGKNTIGSQGGVVGNDQFSNIAMVSGASGSNNNFGELAPGSVSGFVYLDANNNGVKDAGEPGLPGVTITLTGINDLGQAVNVVTTTDNNGAYAFSNLRPGTYTITETHPDGLVDGKDSIGTQGGTVGQDQLSNIPLSAGVNGTDNDFAETLPPEHAVPQTPPPGPIFSKQWFID